MTVKRKAGSVNFGIVQSIPILMVNMLIFLSSLVRKHRSNFKVLEVLRNCVPKADPSIRREGLCFHRFVVVYESHSGDGKRVLRPVMALGSVAMVQAQAQPAGGPAATAAQANAALCNASRDGSNLSVQVRDLCFVLGARDNQLVGYGIVSGLAGDGDKDPEFTLQAVANSAPERSGLTLPPSALTSKNIAAVVLTADIPPFVRSGSRIDVHVSAMGDARSLHGAVLARTPFAWAGWNKSMPWLRGRWQWVVLSVEYRGRAARERAKESSGPAGNLFGERWLSAKFP